MSQNGFLIEISYAINTDNTLSGLFEKTKLLWMDRTKYLPIRFDVKANLQVYNNYRNYLEITNLTDYLDRAVDIEDAPKYPYRCAINVYEYRGFRRANEDLMEELRFNRSLSYLEKQVGDKLQSDGAIFMSVLMIERLFAIMILPPSYRGDHYATEWVRYDRPVYQDNSDSENSDDEHIEGFYSTTPYHKNNIISNG